MSLAPLNASVVAKPFLVTEKSIVLFYIFLILPFFDMVNGFLVVGGYISGGGVASPSQLGRLVATFVLLIICFVKRLNTAWVAVLLYFIALEAFYGLQHQLPYGFMYGIISSYKVIYIFLACISLQYYLKTPRDFEQLGFYLKWNLIFISGSLVFSLVTGLGNSTYGHGFGTKGFFASGNGIGIYLGVMTLIVFALRKYKIYTNVSTFSLLLFATAAGIVGSKTALILSLMCFGCFMWFSRFRIVWLMLLLGIFVVIIPYLIDIFFVVFDVVVKRYEYSESLIHFLGSGRVDFVTNALSDFFNQDNIYIRLLFGSGAFLSFQDPAWVVIYDTLETDLFDVLFMYGVAGLFLFLMFFMFLGFSLRKYPVLLLAFILLFCHSVFAGHVLFNGMSSLVIVVLFLLADFLNKGGVNAS